MKTVSALTLALVVFAASAATARADSLGNRFVTVSTGNGFVTIKAGRAYSSLNDDYSDKGAASYSFQTGYRWTIGENSSLGLEAGYVDFGSISGSSSSVSVTLEGGVTKGLNYQYLFGGDNSYYFEARAGFLRWSGSVRATNSGSLLGAGGISQSDNDSGSYAGVAFGRYISPNFGISLGYDFHRAEVLGRTINVGVFTVSGEFRF